MLKERLKGLVIGVVMTLVVTIFVPAFGSAVTSAIQVTYRNIGVSVDGRSIVTEQEPFVFEGRTYLAVRDIAEAFGAEIRLNESTNTVEISSRQPAQTSNPSERTQSTSTTNKNQQPSNPSITRERAEQIAVDWLYQNGATGTWRDGGISMDFEHGRWVWEIEYENRTHEWDFYIDVNTGEVIDVDRN